MAVEAQRHRLRGLAAAVEQQPTVGQAGELVVQGALLELQVPAAAVSELEELFGVARSADSRTVAWAGGRARGAGAFASTILSLVLNEDEMSASRGVPRQG